MKLPNLILFLAFNVLAQPFNPFKAALENYNNATQNCAGNSCKDDAEQAAIGIIQRYISTGAFQSPPARDADLAEGRRIALRLMPDRQLGTSPSSGGGTSLTSLASVSELFSAAMESGAFQRNTTGAISTIRINPAGAVRLFSGECPRDAYQDFPACVSEDRSHWRGFSVMASFDSSRNDQAAPADAANPASSANAIFLRARRGLASAGLRYDFYKAQNAKSKDLRQAWDTGVEKLRDKAATYAEAYAAGPLPIMAAALKAQLPSKLHDLLLPLKPEERQAAAEKFLTDSIQGKVLPQPWLDFQDARRALLKSQVELFRDTLDRRLFSLEFQHQRPKDEPEYGSLTFIWGDTAGTHEETVDGVTLQAPNWSFTANAGANFFYDKQKIQKDRILRDIQVSFQADRKLWHWKPLNQPTFTFAAYFQRLTDDAVLSFNSDAIAPGTGIVLPKPADVILKGTKGNVGIVQAKLTIPLKDSGVSFPMAVTWSNRTELLRLPGADVRGHFGLQFDLDKLLTGLKP